MMNAKELEEIYHTHCCDILPSSEDFPRMIVLGTIFIPGDIVTIYEDPEPEEDQCKYRCLRDSSRLFDEHMSNMTKITQERKAIERRNRELNQSRWNKERQKGSR